MENVNARRKFLKKAAYAAPIVLALGAMTAPISAHASVIFTKGTWNAGGEDQFEAGQNYDNVKKAVKDGYLSYDYQKGAYVTTDKFNQLQFSTNDGGIRDLFNALFKNV